MADVPNINPTKPIWPTRPDGRQKRNQPEDEKGNRKDEKPTEENKDGESDGHIDEYA